MDLLFLHSLVYIDHRDPHWTSWKILTIETNSTPQQTSHRTIYDWTYLISPRTTNSRLVPRVRSRAPRAKVEKSATNLYTRGSNLSSVRPAAVSVYLFVVKVGRDHTCISNMDHWSGTKLDSFLHHWHWQHHTNGHHYISIMTVTDSHCHIHSH